MKLLLSLAMTTGLLAQQGVDTGMLLQRPTKNWPTFNGDYTGQRFSPLKQINTSNVRSLTLAWSFQTRQAAMKATPLVVDGIAYFSVPNHVWAADARTGRQIWHFSRTSIGDHLASRGVTMFKDRIYFGTPDAHLIALDARNGTKVWEVEVADVKFGYYISAAPLVVKDKLLVGMSGDQLNMPGFLEARDLNDGKLVWRWDAIPKPGEPGSETWPNAEIMARGGGMTWVQGVYDPALNLTYWGTGNPHPVRAGNVRRGANLFTCTLVALDVDTGKMKWYIQTSPHDTYDRDANQTPILIDGAYQGQPPSSWRWPAAAATTSCSIARQAKVWSPSRTAHRTGPPAWTSAGSRFPRPRSIRPSTVRSSRARRPTGGRRASAPIPDSFTSTAAMDSASGT
jgi:PQQ-dependent dehydrogenase (methanol/ethanol family)